MTSIQDQYAESLDSLIRSGASFACWFLPNREEPALMVLPAKPAEVADISEMPAREAFVFAPFRSGAHSPVLVFDGAPILRGYSGFPKCSRPEAAAEAYRQTCLSTTEEQYSAMFARVMGELQSGRFSKLVLSRLFVTENNGRSIGRIFFGLRRANTSAFTYMLFAPKCGLWLGASPEILIEKHSDVYQTVALAGTMPINEQKQYVWSKKEREEQQIVTDYIREQLAACGVSDLSVSNPATSVAGNVAHLKTNFRFRSEASVGTLAKQLHPTPAVCGLPKDDAWRFITEAEHHSREYYSGIVGVSDNGGSANLYVNLRCMKVDGSQFVLFAGGGITLRSECGKEWAETGHKLQMLRSAIDNG